MPASSVPDVTLELPIALRKRPRTCTTHPSSNFVSYEQLSATHRAFVTSISTISVPKSVMEALAHPDWKAAMDAEMTALSDTGTWELTSLPPGKSVVGCRWIYTVKFLPDGSIERLKARLVAKGYTQIYGLDFSETFSPVAKLASVRIFLSFAAQLNWPLH